LTKSPLHFNILRLKSLPSLFLFEKMINLVNVFVHKWKLTFCSIHQCQECAIYIQGNGPKVACLLHREKYIMWTGLYKRRPSARFSSTYKQHLHTELTSRLVRVTGQGVNAYFLFFWLKRMTSFR
jgi:hypothetical protein